MMHCGTTRAPAGLPVRVPGLLLLLVLACGAAGPASAQARRGAPAPRQAPSPAARDSAAAPAAPAAAAPRVLRSAPEGDSLGSLAPDARLEVLGREGEWARVRVEGWVRVPPGADLGASEPLRGLTLRALRTEPDRYRGQPVRWQIQFVSVQTADSMRTDLRPGEEYILARDPGGEPGFVYVVVPARLRAAVRQLVPLQRVEIVGRVRTGRSALMGHPVLDLEELRP